MSRFQLWKRFAFKRVKLLRKQYTIPYISMIMYVMLFIRKTNKRRHLLILFGGISFVEFKLNKTFTVPFKNKVTLAWNTNNYTKMNLSNKIVVRKPLKMIKLQMETHLLWNIFSYNEKNWITLLYSLYHSVLSKLIFMFPMRRKT